MSVVSARTFNQSPSQIKAMAAAEPVFVTDRGKPTIVVLAIDEYERLTGSGSVRDSLQMRADIEFEAVISLELGEVPEL